MHALNVKRGFFVLAVLPMLWLTGPFFIPVFMGLSMAVVSMQLRDLGIDRLRIKRWWAHVLVPTLLVLTFLLMIAFVVISLSSAIRYVRTEIDMNDVSGVLAKIKNSKIFVQIHSSLDRVGVRNFDQMTGDFSKDVLSNVTDPLKSIFMGLPELFVGLFIFVLSFVGVYLNEVRIKTFFREQRLVPQEYTQILTHSFSEYSYSSFVAAGVTAIAQGLLIGIGAAVSGAPSAFIFGVIGALSSLLPYVGTIPVSIALALLLYAGDATTTQYLMLLVFAILAGISDNVLRPVIVNSRSDLHPWVAFISIFGGLYFFGLAGVFIGPVLAGMSIDLSKKLLQEV